MNLLIRVIKKFLPSRIKWWLRLSYYKFFLILKFRTFHLFKYVELETTSVCNRKCQYCPNSKYSRGNHLMKESLYKRIIDQLSEINFTGAIFIAFYSEPLLDKRLPRLMKYTRKKLPYCMIKIFTNGDYLTKNLFRKLIGAGVNEFLVTRHGSPLTKDLKYLVKHPFSRDKIYYRISLPLRYRYNRGGLVKIPYGKKIEKCLRPSENLTIDYAGNVVLCCNDYFSTVKFGNLKRSHIIDIWKKKNYKVIRKETKRGIFNLPVCQKCMGPYRVEYLAFGREGTSED